MKLKLSQKIHTCRTLIAFFEGHKYFMIFYLKLFIQLFLAVGFVLPAGGASVAAVSSKACQQEIAELGVVNDPRLPFSSLPERVAPIQTLKDFAEAMSQGLNLRPEQKSLFSIYIQNSFGDPSSSGIYTLEHFFNILEAHPQLSTPSVREQILEFSVKQTPQPQSLKDFLRTLRRSKKNTRTNLFQIEANLGYWRKILGMAEPQIPSHLKREEKQAFKKKSKEEFLAHLDTIIERETRRRWATESHPQNYRNQAVDLYKALEKERTKLLQEGQDVKYITHAMVDVIDTVGFGNQYNVDLLESKNPFDNIEGIRQVFAERDTVAFNDLNFEQHFAGLRQALNDTRAIEETADKILQIQKDVENQPYVVKRRETFRLRALSLQESPFRGCLGGDCSTKNYFDLALDPNFIYFTLTDSQHRSSGHLTVVLGTAVNKKGESIKTAFIDKIQNISNTQLLSVLEGVRLSLKELGYILGLPQQVGDHNGLSNESVTRGYVTSTILPYLNTSLMGFEPHPHSYNFKTGYSRAYQKLEMLEFDGSIESTAVISAGEIHFPQKAPPSVSIQSVYAPILALQGSSKIEDQIQFLSNIIVIIKFPELGFSRETAREYMWSLIQDPNLDFKLRKKALYTLIEFELGFYTTLDLESLNSALKSFTKREQRLIIGEMSQWKESRQHYRRSFIDHIPNILARADIQILKDVLETPIWRLLLNVNIQNNYGDTVLILSIREGRTELAAALIEAGADVNIQGNDGDTALILSIEEGYTELATALIAAKADVNLHRIAGETVLMRAVTAGDIDIIKAVLDAGAHLNIQNNSGDTALIWAVFDENIDIVKTLIDAGADVNVQDNRGDTALIVASYKAKTKIAAALIAAKADVNLQNEVGDTALMWATQKGDIDIAKVLIAAGANVNIQNNSGETALIAASYKVKTKTKIVVVAALIAAKADVNLQNIAGDTALMWAIQRGDIDIVKALIDAGADVNLQNKEGKTALKIARSLNYNDIAELLIQQELKRASGIN